MNLERYCNLWKLKINITTKGDLPKPGDGKVESETEMAERAEDRSKSNEDEQLPNFNLGFEGDYLPQFTPSPKTIKQSNSYYFWGCGSSELQEVNTY